MDGEDGYLDASELPPRSNSPLQPPVSLTFYLLNNFPHAPLPPLPSLHAQRGVYWMLLRLRVVEAVGGGPPFALRFAVRSTVTDWSKRTKRVGEGGRTVVDLRTNTSYREKGTHDSFSDVLGVVFPSICIFHAGQV